MLSVFIYACIDKSKKSHVSQKKRRWGKANIVNLLEKFIFVTGYLPYIENIHEYIYRGRKCMKICILNSSSSKNRIAVKGLINFFNEAQLSGAQLSGGSIVGSSTVGRLNCRSSTVGRLNCRELNCREAQLSGAQLSGGSIVGSSTFGRLNCRGLNCRVTINRKRCARRK